MRECLNLTFHLKRQSKLELIFFKSLKTKMVLGVGSVQGMGATDERKQACKSYKAHIVYKGYKAHIVYGAIRPMLTTVVLLA